MVLTKNKSNEGTQPIVRLKILGFIVFFGTAFATSVVFSATSQPLEIANAYMPPIPSVSRTAAVYLTFRNHNDSTKVISSVSSPIAQRAMFHKTTEQNGLSKMKHLEKISIEPGREIELAPGGIHLMLMGVRLKPSIATIQLTLNFESGEQQTLSVPIATPMTLPAKNNAHGVKSTAATKPALRKLINKKALKREK